MPVSKHNFILDHILIFMRNNYYAVPRENEVHQSLDAGEGSPQRYSQVAILRNYFKSVFN